MSETTTTVATTKKSEKPQVVDYKKKALEYLKATGNKLPENQQLMFLEIAAEFQLNPFKREIYAVGYGNNFSVITGYGSYLNKAESSGVYDGYETSWQEDANGKIISCTCLVYRKDRSRPTKQTVFFNEYNLNTSIWKAKPHTMIEKVAIAQAFRKAFPDVLGGMPYTKEEMDIMETTAEVIETKPAQQPTKPVEQPKQVDPELQAAQKRYVELKNSNVFSAEEMAHFKESWSKGWRECMTEMEEAYNLKTAPVEEAQVEPEPQDNSEPPF